MTSLWTSKEIAEATGGAASADFSVSGIAFDSREIGPGDLFIALKGETTDGHLFVDRSVAGGAAAVLVSEPVECPHILVSDTSEALNDLGRAARERTTACVVGVTGSVGKTTTKEALFAALDRGVPDRVHRSVKSYNNHTGVPLSLARTPRDSRFAILEMGMNHQGELSALTRLVRPQVAIVTAIASAHREFFPSEEAIADAKAEIFEGLQPGGTAIIPHDSPHRDRLIAAARPYAGRIISFGLDEGSDVRAAYAIPAATGTMVSARLGETQLNFALSQPGRHMVSNALAVLAAVQAVDGDLGAAALALAELGSLKGRGRRHLIPVEGGEALLIDESYNANPASMAATLQLLGAELVAGRRIAVLGSMKELGDESAALHTTLAAPIREAGTQIIILVGEEMGPLAKVLGPPLQMKHVADAAAATQIVRETVRPGDAILVKGSNSLGLSSLVDALAGDRL